MIHLVGDMTGAMAKPQSVEAIAKRYPELARRYPLGEFLQSDGPSLSYTQWEACSLATTWLTSYQEVDPPARTLLRRLAWFSSEPIPESLLEVEVPGDLEAAAGAWEAISQLEAYSLVNRSGDAPTFSLHRLVQEVARLWQQQREQPEPNELGAALGWLNGAFVGDPQDARSWAVLDPLAPHAKAVAGFAEGSGISEPTSRLNNLAQLLHTNNRLAEAEPLMHTTLETTESTYGPNHPNVATALNHLALMLQDTHRLDEAEPLMRRGVEILIASFGQSYQHPNLETGWNNYITLLQAMGLPEAEIQAKLDALQPPT